jgi:hypothetical protein
MVAFDLLSIDDDDDDDSKRLEVVVVPMTSALGWFPPPVVLVLLIGSMDLQRLPPGALERAACSDDDRQLPYNISLCVGPS